MMTVRQAWLRGLVVGIAVVALGSGCNLFKKKGGDIGDGPLVHLPDPESALEEDAMGNIRFSEDGRLTSPEWQCEPVYFDYDSFRVNDAELAKIQAVATKLRSARSIVCVTEGHCDERGSREYNMSLGEHRALAIRASLVSLGVDGSRIQTRSYGEEAPAVDGHNESAWRLNRRVEFAFYEQ